MYLQNFNRYGECCTNDVPPMRITYNWFAFVAEYCIWYGIVIFRSVQIKSQSFKSWVVLTNLSVLIAVFLSSSETVNASLDKVFQNGYFFSKCYLFGAFKPYPVRSLEGAEVSSSSLLNANQIRWIAFKNIAYCLNLHLEFFNRCTEGGTKELPPTGLYFLLLLQITAASAK